MRGQGDELSGETEGVRDLKWAVELSISNLAIRSQDLDKLRADALRNRAETFPAQLCRRQRVRL